METGAREWWQTRWAFAAAVLLAAVPLLWPAVPPLTDLPGHIGQYRIMLDANHGPLAQWYVVQWRATGNLGVEAIVWLIGPLIGIEPATKLVTIAIPMLTVAGVLTLSRTVHGRVTPFAILALPLAYGQPFGMGFLNFTLSAALALFALSLWLTMAGSRWRAPVFLPVGLTIWLCHIFGWAVLGLAVFAAELAISRRPIRAALACWPLAAPLPFMLATAGGGGLTGEWNAAGKLFALIGAMRDRWLAWDIVATIVVIGGIAFALRRARVDPRFAAIALAMLAAFLALPGWMMGSAFADMRLVPLVLTFALLAFAPKNSRQARVVSVIAAAVFLTRIAGLTASYAISAQQQDRALAALDHIPDHARVVMLVRPTCDAVWPLARYDHLGGLVTARRRAFVNDHFQGNAAAMFDVRYPAAGPFERDPSQFLSCAPDALPRALAAVPRGTFDRVWVLNLGTSTPPSLPGMTRLWADGGHALYRID
ncbi:hypothetical protein ASE86_14015 [Sphingomonas sp. Leaf33]|uniref:hypothetical protein n=1 Tax=Sphingomonas sp. Leaf33 TaxID=1736215 RepID=UPI00070153F8|nr:hypothetical protein [Sphingomonas sp. Leaf33]KQN19566.1 hypothetical protein ASE86_14015 [Sphingomonas sp. Leaf33]